MWVYYVCLPIVSRSKNLTVATLYYNHKNVEVLASTFINWNQALVYKDMLIFLKFYWWGSFKRKLDFFKTVANFDALKITQ